MQTGSLTQVDGVFALFLIELSLEVAAELNCSILLSVVAGPPINT